MLDGEFARATLIDLDPVFDQHAAASRTEQVEHRKAQAALHQGHDNQIGFESLDEFNQIFKRAKDRVRHGHKRFAQAMAIVVNMPEQSIVQLR